MAVKLQAALGIDVQLDPQTGIRVPNGIAVGDWGVDSEGHPYWNRRGARTGERATALGFDETGRVVIVP